ncbi:MAG TPA: hypothetical protein VK807_03630 [Gemmatimonadaceae bacterium]|nr:hypothetical protein [Gemmatimonadaceae bacterium]
MEHTRHGQFEAHTSSHEVGPQTCSREVIEARECAQQFYAQDVSASRRKRVGERKGCEESSTEKSRRTSESCRASKEGRCTGEGSQGRCTSESCGAGEEGRCTSGEGRCTSGEGRCTSESRTSTRARSTRASRTSTDASRRRRRGAQGNEQVQEGRVTGARHAQPSFDRTTPGLIVARRS